MRKTDDFMGTLTTTEQAVLEQAEDRQLSLRDQLRTWEWCGDAVEGGETMMVYEFANALDIRTAIQDSLQSLPDPLAEKVKEFVITLDDAYQRCTTEDDCQELSKYMNISEQKLHFWWYTRRPTQIPRGW